MTTESKDKLKQMWLDIELSANRFQVLKMQIKGFSGKQKDLESLLELKHEEERKFDALNFEYSHYRALLPVYAENIVKPKL